MSILSFNWVIYLYFFFTILFVCDSINENPMCEKTYHVSMLTNEISIHFPVHLLLECVSSDVIIRIKPATKLSKV